MSEGQRRPGRPPIPLEEVTERAWWPKVQLGKPGGITEIWNPHDLESRQLCWLWDDALTNVNYRGKLWDIRRLLFYMLRNEEYRTLAPMQRLQPLDNRNPGRLYCKYGVSCINPWHKEPAPLSAERMRAKVLKYREYDYRGQYCTTILGTRAPVGDVADLAMSRIFAPEGVDEELLMKILDGNGDVRLRGEEFDYYLHGDVRVAVEFAKLLEKLEAGELTVGEIQERADAALRRASPIEDTDARAERVARLASAASPSPATPSPGADVSASGRPRKHVKGKVVKPLRAELRDAKVVQPTGGAKRYNVVKASQGESPWE